MTRSPVELPGPAIADHDKKLGKVAPMLWEVDIYPAQGQPDLAERRIVAEAAELGLGSSPRIAVARGYLIQGELDRADVDRIAKELLADDVVETTVVGEVGTTLLTEREGCPGKLVHVMVKPGVTDPEAQSTLGAISEMDIDALVVRTLRKYWIEGLSDPELDLLCTKVLANDAIEQVIVGPLPFKHLEVGSPYEYRLVHVPLGELDNAALERLSRERQLYLSIAEMSTIQTHYRELGRDPTDAELETIAQTWSEHCSHKTLKGRIQYRDPSGEQRFENMLRETIFAVTETLREQAGEEDWCVSVFEDNAGIVRFDEEFNICFKVETHNHPSALEPYGGANTGVGGVVRDPMGTGLGAKPVANTDVFCFAPPDTPAGDVPEGVLHPKRVMRGVVAGVRDYGNRMGIPTVNGAIYFDPRYLGNPLVYCGTVGLLPHDKSFKESKPGDHIVAVGGRTGRDGIHGATFSSAELTSQSESLSGGSVQIGNAITEKMVLDVLLEARDQGLYNAITDCGAGGFSSAVGEMGEKIGAVVWLDRVPLKYEGLSYTEIWISEAQERMVLSVGPDQWEELDALCAAEGVEATIIGQFVSTGRLQLKYGEHEVADVAMSFLHDGRPPVIREAVYEPAKQESLSLPAKRSGAKRSGGVFTDVLTDILGSLNVASKEWVIRQYDHEVQGGSVLKPLVGVKSDGPGDAAVVRPLLDSRRGVVLSVGMNPHYGDRDTYHMAASAIDEAVRNCVAVGADPSRIALLDNFCWGNTDRPETLGSLVRAALACRDIAGVLGTPFISGKDSLNNEFAYVDKDGQRRSLSIPPTLLISAIGQIADVGRCVSMDLKTPGNLIYQVGTTKDELGGSHYSLVESLDGGRVPEVDAEMARRTFAAIHQAIDHKLVRACHDLSEGGLAVAAAEMAFAGGYGAKIRLSHVPQDLPVGDKNDSGETETHADRTTETLLFSESNTRFLCEVPPDAADEFEKILSDVPHAAIGEVTEASKLLVLDVSDAAVIDAAIGELKEAWQAPLDW